MYVMFPNFFSHKELKIKFFSLFIQADSMLDMSHTNIQGGESVFLERAVIRFTK